MKLKIFILTYILISITLTAQDSITVNLQRTYFNNLTFDSERYPPVLPVTLSEMKLSRSWSRDTIHFTPVNTNDAGLLKFHKKKESFIDSDLFLIVVGSAVAFGTAAAYFKLESDNSYDNYLTTKDKKFKDKTDRYDIYSGVALGVMELNVGFLIYKFLTD